MPEYTHAHRVRYRECDPMGVVYHTHYLDFFEVARTEMLRSLGISYREVEERGVIMPVIEASVKYHRPAHYDDLLHVVTTMPEDLPGVRLEIGYRVVREHDGVAVASGKTTLCFVDRESGRPTRAPEFVSACFTQ